MRSDPDSAALLLGDLQNLSLAAERILGLLDAAVVARRAAREAHRLLGTDATFVSVRERSDLLVMRGTWQTRTEAIRRVRVPLGDGLGGKILFTHKPLAVEDYGQVESITPELVEIVAHREGIRGNVGVPLLSQGQVVGVLYAGLRSVGHIGDRAQSLMLEFSRTLGPTIGSAMRAEQSTRLSVQQERQRIASELHDTIGQLLFGLGVSARRARASLPAEAAGLLDELTTIEAQASQAASSLRETLRALAPATPEEALPATIQMDAHRFSERSGTPAHLAVIGELFDLEPTTESVLLAVVREGLHNVEKHAEASIAILTLHYDEDAVEVVIQDDGRGLPADFRIQPLPRSGQAWGLTSLQQRVEQLGGRLLLLPNEDGGVTLRARLPAQRAP